MRNEEFRETLRVLDYYKKRVRVSRLKLLIPNS